MRRLARLKADADTWRTLEKQTGELLSLVTLALGEGDQSLEAEVTREAEELEKRFSALEFELFLSGEYDRRDAILAVHAGAGGTESQDWAELLLRMYLRWAERKNYQAEVLETSPGEEVGIMISTPARNGVQTIMERSQIVRVQA